MIVALIEKIYSFLWGDLIHIPLPGGGSVGISLLIILLIPTGIYFTVRTRLLPIRMFPDMIKALTGKKENKDSLSTFQTLIVSTATRVGMGNLVGVVAAISVGGAGAVFWMWITAIIGSSTAFVEATLAQLHKEPDPLYSGYRGGPAYYIHHYFEDKSGKKKKHVIIAVLFAISGLICWCGISQVISNSVTSSFENAFGIPPIYTTVILVAVATVIVLRKNATVKVLDIVVPIMAVCYFAITIFIIIKNIGMMPSVFSRIFEEAFGIRQVAAGGFGAVLMNGVKRGLFSNEAGMGSTPHAHARAKAESPHHQGLCAMISVFIDTFVILNLTVFAVLTTDAMSSGKDGTALTQAAFMQSFGNFGSIFIAICLLFFAFSTILGWHFFGLTNAKYLFGEGAAKVYSFIVVICIVIGSMLKVNLVWALADFFNALMVIPNVLALLALSHVVVAADRKAEAITKNVTQAYQVAEEK